MVDSISEINAKPLRRSERLGRQHLVCELPEREALVRLFAKYDVPVPRYTSYPPATQFTSHFTDVDYLDHIAHVIRERDRPEISLYVHLPFCDTLCYFCGCTMIVSNNRQKIAEYLEYLKREISLVRESIGGDPVVVQMHWGGGSPTHLTPAEISELGTHIYREFEFADDAEVSIEIDPRGLTQEHIAAMQCVGFNRASIGVQDFASDVQIAINRVQPRSITEQVIAWCRAAGMDSINLDLIYGLPYQTTTSFRDTLSAVSDISPDRIALYSFAYVPWVKPHQQLIPLEIVPQASSKLALLEQGIRSLTDSGYDYLGMDHFAKPSDSLIHARNAGSLHRNFQGYSTHAGTDVFAFGMSAISRVENAFAQGAKELPTFYSMLDEGRLPVTKGYTLTAEDELREHIIMQIMCDMRVNKRETERLFGIDFDREFATALTSLEKAEHDGLCTLTDEDITITPTGRFFLRNIASAFDAYMRVQSTHRTFSQAL